MKYIALLRGINVGGNRRVEMKRLKTLFESLKYTNVSTYINSGNVIFESDKNKSAVCEDIKACLKKEFGFDIQTLVKLELEMQKIAEAIPKDWKNDTEHKTDVAYLFDEIDLEKTIDEIPVKKEYLDIRYIKGAIYWHIDRKNYNKSHINKLIGHKLYQFMTVRNVNTARFLAGHS
ncbi:MAG: DUF1697 domain-containing protein [Microgenomates group bacterium]